MAPTPWRVNMIWGVSQFRTPPQPELHQTWLMYMEIVPKILEMTSQLYKSCNVSWKWTGVSIGLLKFQCQRSYLRIEAFMQTELTWCMIEQLSGAIDRRTWICMNISEIFMIHVYIYRNTCACMYMNVYGCIWMYMQVCICVQYVYVCAVCLVHVFVYMYV